MYRGSPLTECCECLSRHPPASRVIIKLKAQPPTHQQPPCCTYAVLHDPLDGGSSRSGTHRAWGQVGEGGKKGEQGSINKELVLQYVGAGAGECGMRVYGPLWWCFRQAAC
jgi:hypothetical protein